MKLLTHLLLVITALISLLSCSKDDPTTPATSGFTVTAFAPKEVTKSNSMKIYAHYMPWFEDKTTSGTGKWGYHWTMKNCNPDVVDANGKRQIASHFYPLIGPYASSDPAVIENHLLLMKYAGIDGILIDWYGSFDVNDYALVKRNTNALIAVIDKVGLKFAIVYEDRTVPAVMSGTGAVDAVSVARADMAYIQTNYFTKSSYIKIDNRPLLMVFGPDYIKTTNEWDMIIAQFGSTNKPIFMPLYGSSSLVGNSASGEYLWPWGDGIDVAQKYPNASKFPYFMGGAWPGFRDYYKEGGAGNNLFVIDHANGTFWDSMLSKATQFNPKMLQLCTWNDFGEGTMIEPTNEFQYTFLEKLQTFAGVSYTKAELQKISKQFTLRKSLSTDKEATKVLDQAFYCWINLQKDRAIHLVDSIATARNK